MTTIIMAIPPHFPFFLASNLAALHHTRCATMNSKEKPWRWEKRKQERNPNQFLKRNDEDRRRRALVSLLFSSLICFHGKRGGGAGRRRRLQGQQEEGEITVARCCSMGPSPINFKKIFNFFIRIPNTACRQSNGKYSTISTQPQCPFIHSSNGSKCFSLDINFMYSHVESIFCPLFILGVTFSPP